MSCSMGGAEWSDSASVMLGPMLSLESTPKMIFSDGISRSN